jgi:hypothetical protein
MLIRWKKFDEMKDTRKNSEEVEDTAQKRSGEEELEIITRESIESYIINEYNKCYKEFLECNYSQAKKGFKKLLTKSFIKSMDELTLLHIKTSIYKNLAEIYSQMQNFQKATNYFIQVSIPFFTFSSILVFEIESK